MKQFRTAFALVLAATLVISACGDDDSADQEAIDAVAADLMDDSDFGEIDINKEDAQCAAERIVDGLGADRVEEAGFTGEDPDPDLSEFSEEELGTMASGLEACVDNLEGALTAAVKEGMLEESNAEFPVTDEEADCVAGDLVEALGVERLLVVGATGEGDPFAAGAVTGAEAEAVANGFVDCVDMRQLFVDQFESQGIPAEVADCLAGEIAEDDLRALFTAQFSGEEVDPETLLGSALETCGVQ